MAERQQMTVIDKLKAILKLTKGTQKELAGKLGVKAGAKEIEALVSLPE